MRLTHPRAGEILDHFGGLLDLQTRHVRVLHANSFIEDPTRIYRAVRFAVRLGFQIERQTQDYIHHAMTSGIYLRVETENARAPALQTRLKSELKYILRAPYWQPALKLLADLEALRCIHPSLTLDRNLWHQLRLVDYWLKRTTRDSSTEEQPEDVRPGLSITAFTSMGAVSIPARWQILLEVLIAYLTAAERGPVAEKLQLTADSIERLQTLEPLQTELVQRLPGCQRPSQIVKLLKQYDLIALILIAVKSERAIRRQIWQYLTRWLQVKPPIDGHALKLMGYPPGPLFRQILDDLLAAQLDGRIGLHPVESQPQKNDRAVAQQFATVEEFLAENYPLSR